MTIVEEGVSITVSSDCAFLPFEAEPDAPTKTPTLQSSLGMHRGWLAKKKRMVRPKICKAKSWTTLGTCSMNEKVRFHAINKNAECPLRDMNFDRKYTVHHIVCYLGRATDTKVVLKLNGYNTAHGTA